MSFRTFIKSVLLILIIFSSSYSQEYEYYISQGDTLYRYNSALRTLDSILQNEVYGQPLIDTAFFSTYGNAESVTLEQLIYFGLRNNPQLKSMFTTADAEYLRGREQGFLPDPMFEFELDDIMADFSGIGMINFFISQMFMWPGKLSAMERMGYYNAEMMRNDAVMMGLDIINMIKMNYYDLYLNYRKLDINRENQLILQTLVSAAEARYSVGLGMQADVFKGQIELSRIRNEEFILVQDQKNALNNLSALTKLRINTGTKIKFNYDDIFYVLDKDGFDLISIDSLRLVNYALTNRPELKALRNKILMNETALESARLARYPDFEVQFGYKILPFEMSNAFQFMIGVTLPFAPWVSEKYDIGRERSLLQIRASTEEYDSMQTRIRNDVLNVLNEAAKTKETINYYRNVMIPQSENMMRSMQYSYENKMANFIDVIDAFRMLQDSREMLEEMNTMYIKMIIDLEKLTGANIKKFSYGR